MKEYSSVVNMILENLKSGKYIFVKCEDDSERFLCKRSSVYLISTDSVFKKDVIGCSEEDRVSDFLERIRGYGIYTPDDCDIDVYKNWESQIPKACDCG